MRNILWKPVWKKFDKFNFILASDMLVYRSSTTVEILPCITVSWSNYKIWKFIRIEFRWLIFELDFNFDNTDPRFYSDDDYNKI